MEMALCILNSKIIRIQVFALNVVQVKAALQAVTYNGNSWVEKFWLVFSSTCQKMALYGRTRAAQFEWFLKMIWTVQISVLICKVIPKVNNY